MCNCNLTKFWWTSIIGFFCLFSRHIRSSIIMEHGHNKYTRPADVRWITIEDLEPDRQYQFWVTAVTSAGEGRSSNVITETPSARVPAKITSLSDVIYTPTLSSLNLQCTYLGEPIPESNWFFNGKRYVCIHMILFQFWVCIRVVGT